MNMFASQRASLDNRAIDCNALMGEFGILILPAEERLTILLASLRDAAYSYLLCDRPKNELSLHYPSVWHGQPFRLDHFRSVQGNVKIDIAWPFVDDLHASHAILYRLKPVEELHGLEASLDLHSAVSTGSCILVDLTACLPRMRR